MSMPSLDEAKTMEEKRAALLVKYRNYTIDSVEKEDMKLVYWLSKGDSKFLMHILLDQKTVGIAFVRALRDELKEEEEGTQGIIVSDGKYTYSARSNAPEMSIELVPKITPTFDIFEHKHVPRHELLSVEERKEVSDKYHAEAYQFPWIKSTDPISIVLGAKAGDVLKVTQKSETAGRYSSYRYVV